MDYKAIEQLTREVAIFLGPAWKFEAQDENSVWQRIQGPGEAKLWLQLVEYGCDKGRVTVSGSLNIGKNGQYWTTYENHNRVHPPVISVAESRGAEVIAKEIKRRLLPEYLRILALAVSQRDSQIAYENKRRNTLVELAKIVHARVPDGDDVGSTSFYRNDAAYGKIQAHGDNTVSLDLHNCTLEQAQHILKFIAK